MNLSDFLGVPAVVDNLYTQSATDMLSANQGYEIGLAIADLPNTFSRYDASQSLSDTQKAQILTNIGAKKSFNLLPTKTASYTLLTTDFQDGVDLYDKVYVRFDSASATNLNIDNTLSSLPNLTEIRVRNVNATGFVTLVAGSGVTLNGILAFTVQNEVKSLVKVGTNEWDVIGALS